MGDKPQSLQESVGTPEPGSCCRLGSQQGARLAGSWATGVILALSVSCRPWCLLWRWLPRLALSRALLAER